MSEVKHHHLSLLQILHGLTYQWSVRWWSSPAGSVWGLNWGIPWSRFVLLTLGQDDGSPPGRFCSCSYHGVKMTYRRDSEALCWVLLKVRSWRYFGTKSFILLRTSFWSCLDQQALVWWLTVSSVAQDFRLFYSGKRSWPDLISGNELFVVHCWLIVTRVWGKLIYLLNTDNITCRADVTMSAKGQNGETACN